MEGEGFSIPQRGPFLFCYRRNKVQCKFVVLQWKYFDKSPEIDYNRAERLYAYVY